MRKYLIYLILLAALFGTVVMTVAPAFAKTHHGIYNNVGETGISIAPIAHGQMPVLANHRKQVLATAQQVLPNDATATQLTRYVTNQNRACLLGLVPLSLDSESSPFHLCTHATLAGTMALVQHLQAAASHHPDVQALMATLNAAMLANGTLGICINSSQAFNTASLNWPTVLNHELHSTEQIALLSAILLVGVLAFLMLPLLRSTRGNRLA